MCRGGKINPGDKTLNMYTVQVRELQEEVEEARTRCQELEVEIRDVQDRLHNSSNIHEQESMNR